MLAKRLFDMLLSLVALLLLAPVFFLIAVWVKLDSAGPIFFRQVRIGRNGRPFSIYKFRTMVADAEGRGHQVTSRCDMRITRSGKVLRKYKLDELPQLINVLLGDMSLVGPRPEVPKYVEMYTSEQKQILTVRPGITGVTQLEFRDEETLLEGRDNVEEFYIGTVMPQKLRLDIGYVQNRTSGSDLRLLLRTVSAVLQKSTDAKTEVSLHRLEAGNRGRKA